MNFEKIHPLLKEGKKGRRDTWNSNEFVWVIKKGEIVLHNKPYSPEDRIVAVDSVSNKRTPGYYYVVEKDDPVAKDWVVVD